MRIPEHSNHDLDFSSRMNSRHKALTECALVLVFGFDEGTARDAVAEMWDRFPEQHLRDVLLHEDPLNLGAVIANVPPMDITEEKFADGLQKYRDKARKVAETAQRDYETHGTRIEREARIRERAHGLWEKEGHSEGNYLDHWLRAEQEVTRETTLPRDLVRKLKRHLTNSSRSDC